MFFAALSRVRSLGVELPAPIRARRAAQKMTAASTSGSFLVRAARSAKGKAASSSGGF
jgi:hypothetical protein